jgi:penicillin V acylase-like amidase (Ntn superfamily)
MLVKLLYLLLSLITAFILCMQAIGCTAAFLKHRNHRLLVANMDWPSGDGMIIVNKRGNFKSALTNPDKPFTPARWKSRYGSVTFNQYAVDWPWAGMNESGLVGAGLMMRWAEFPEPGQQPSVFILQWLQYQLDNFSSVSEVVAHVSEIRIRQVSSKNGVHYFFCDLSGDAAVIDIIDGKINVYQGDSLPVRAMANEPYAASLVYLKRIKGFGGTFAISDSNLSNDRFARAADGIRKFSPKDFPEAIDTAFDVLDSVSMNAHPRIFTQWQIVFALKENQICFRTRSDSTCRNIDMEKLGFACNDSIRISEITSVGELNPAAMFKPYSYERNRQHVEAFFRRHPLKPTEYENRVDRVARYPATFICEE